MKWELELQHREGTTNTRLTFLAAGAESALTMSGRASALLADTVRPPNSGLTLGLSFVSEGFT